MKLGVSAKRTVNKRAFSHCLLYLLFHTGLTLPFLTISTMLVEQEKLPNYAELNFGTKISLDYGYKSFS